MSHYSCPFNNGIKARRYSILQFQNSTSITRLGFQKPHLNPGIIWIIRIRWGFENTTQIAIASNRVTPDYPSHCPCCGHVPDTIFFTDSRFFQPICTLNTLVPILKTVVPSNDVGHFKVELVSTTVYIESIYATILRFNFVLLLLLLLRCVETESFSILVIPSIKCPPIYVNITEKDNITITEKEPIIIYVLEEVKEISNNHCGSYNN
ncbi:hypothetical protein PIROE2DRAFT_18854 [Piromyces sp. E2]|nr:hypothetical protein PIROE2DRAFT_18854 [Piromyces sp. E2]|eukprot:OUM56517.1 hypothetical protein PIROE2DRAFT_18854 [Piromyces sp. E2]